MSIQKPTDSLFKRNEVYVSTALIGAHAHAKGEGFRQRDVKFYIELFSNWIEIGLAEAALPVQNTQVLRYIEALVSDGYARKITRKGPPNYRLTRIGLIELLARIVERRVSLTNLQFLFLFYFLKSYKPIIEALIKSEGNQFPSALKVEVDSLLDTDSLLANELRRAEQDLKRMEIRIADSVGTVALIPKLKSKGWKEGEIIEEVEKLFPYELNSQKPLTELIGDIPVPQRLWELEEGNRKRLKIIWEPEKRMICWYIEELKKL